MAVVDKEMQRTAENVALLAPHGARQGMATFKTPTLKKAFLSTLIAQSVLFGCGSPQEPTGSHIKQLGTRDFSCINYSAEQTTQALRGMPEGFINEASFRLGKVERVKNHLTGVPRPYLEWLFSLRGQNGFRIAERNLGPGTLGVTMRSIPSLVPSYIDLSARSDAVDGALLHEIGHAVENRAREANRSFADRIVTAFRGESNTRTIQSYARTSATEYFAEAFSNFYCSKDAQEFIASNLPETYALLKSSLLPASFAGFDPSALAKDTWMQLTDDSSETHLEVSLPSAVKKVALCKGKKDDCTKTPTVFTAMTSSSTKITGRTVYRSERALEIETDLQLTVLVYDDNDKATAVKTVEFREVGGP